MILINKLRCHVWAGRRKQGDLLEGQEMSTVQVLSPGVGELRRSFGDVYYPGIISSPPDHSPAMRRGRVGTFS